MAKGGDQGDKSKGINGDKLSPPPSPISCSHPSRPTPRRGSVPVPGGNRTPPPTPAPTSRSLPLPWPRLQMGVPGVSSFTPYVRTRVLTSPPPPPQTQALDEGSSTNSRAQAVTAVASGSKSPTSSRKRGLDVGNSNADEGDRVRCSICQKEFQSGKALFGHMRSHPGRGWKGAHPPPTFNASEEFADLIPLFQPPVPDNPAPEPEPEPPARPASPECAGDAADIEEKALEEEDSGSGGGGRFIPDLNN